MSEEERIEKAISLIAEACELVGWQVAIPANDQISFMIIGHTDALEAVSEKLDREIH